MGEPPPLYFLSSGPTISAAQATRRIRGRNHSLPSPLFHPILRASKQPSDQSEGRQSNGRTRIRIQPPPPNKHPEGLVKYQKNGLL